MHIVNFSQTVDLHFIKFEEGVGYLMEDPMAGEMLARRPYITKLTHLKADRLPLLRNMWFAAGELNRIGIIRPGGLGDLLFLTPVVAKILTLCPAAEIDVICLSPFRSVFDGWERVGTVDYPCPASRLDSYDAILPLEGVIETERELHSVDAMAARAGLTLADKRVIYRVEVEEEVWAQTHFPRHPDRRRLAVQVRASADCRSYPWHRQLAVFTLLREAVPDLEVYLFGSPWEIPEEATIKHPWMTNLTQQPTPPTFRQSAAILAQCDAFLGPDSALTHLAGALEVPAVALYGPFPWKLRTAYAPTIRALTPETPMPCAPCFHHVIGGQRWPSDGPCAATGRCEALAAITPERVAAELKKMLKR